MDNKELADLLADMEAHGLRVRPCETVLPVMTSKVCCGTPTPLGDDGVERYVPWPALPSNVKAVIVAVEGNSMLDAGLLDGDEVVVELGCSAHDGDIVVACLNGEYTTKAFMLDEHGCPWLVPQNEAFEAIAITDEMSFAIIGVVRGVYQRKSKVKAGSMMAYINRARQHELGRGRPRYKSLRQLVAEGLDADEVAERLRPLIQGQKGKRVALVMTCACEAGLFIEQPTFNALTDEFGDLGNRAGYNKQMTMSMNFTTTEKAPILALLKSVPADAS